MKTILACSLAALLSSPALAADLSRTPRTGTAPVGWAGPYIAAGAGYAVDTVDTGAVSIAAEGLRLAGRAGYNFQWGNIVAGPFADIAWTNAKVATNFGEVDLSYAVGGRVGVVMGGALVYANAGWEWQDFTKTGDVDYNPDGMFAGGGIEVNLGSGFAAGLEGRHSWRSDADMDNGATTALVLFSKRF